MRALSNYKEDVMQDEKIIALYWQRDQSAIDESVFISVVQMCVLY